MLDGVLSTAYSRQLKIFRAAGRGELAGVADVAGAGGEEIGIEREDDVGVLDAIIRIDGLAEGHARARTRRVRSGRLILMPLGGGKLFEHRA